MLDRKADPTPGATVIGVYEAKTKFSEIIARAEKGESFVVTRNGRPVARIEPARIVDRERARRAVEGIRRLAASVDLGDVSWDEIKRWRDEGRP
jgi:prevent-host-death family protein